MPRGRPPAPGRNHLSKRQMNGAAAPLRWFGARNYQQDFFNSTADRKPVMDDENAGHFLSRRHSFICISRNGRAVMRQDNAVVLSSPRQEINVLCTGKSNVLYTNNIELGLP
jgi:hypothetical protein